MSDEGQGIVYVTEQSLYKLEFLLEVKGSSLSLIPHCAYRLWAQRTTEGIEVF